jgi:hypothetical protein
VVSLHGNGFSSVRSFVHDSRNDMILTLVLHTVFGIITMGLAVIAVFTIVDFPHKNTFLSAEQTAYVQARIELDRGDAVPDVRRFSASLSSPDAIY